MPGFNQTWTVLPHGPLTEIGEGILTITGQIHLPLVDLERRMTIVRLKDGSTVIYSPVALEDSEMGRIEAFGVPRYLIIPGDAHRLDAKIFKERYPEAEVIAPSGALKRVQKAVPVEATDIDFNDQDVTYHSVAGTAGHEAVLLVRRASGTTLIVNDLIGNLRRKGGFEGWLLHVMGFGDDDPQIPTVERILMVSNKASLREQLLEWANIAGLERIIMSHGEPIEAGATAALRKLADTLN